MRGDDRRELILEAATRIFGAHGYAGTTTAEVARAAGVSQPYVVRLFGTKRQLFLDVLGRSLDHVRTAFRDALRHGSDDPVEHRLRVAYVELTRERGLLLALMHAFMLGADPVVGAAARAGFIDIYRFLRAEAGLTADAAQRFLAGSMLVNTLVGLRLTDDYDTDPEVRELMQAAMPEKLDAVLALAERNAT